MAWTSFETGALKQRGARVLDGAKGYGQSLARLAPDAARMVRVAAAAGARSMRSYWATRSLAQQFAVVAAAVLIAGMATLGYWVSERIKHGIMHNNAASGALFMDSYVAPLVQDLATGQELPQSSILALDRVLRHAAISNRVSAIKIWRPDGVIVYSNWPEKIGQKFKPTPNFERALRGVISAEFEGQYHEQDNQERALRAPLLEIYAPVRERTTGDIIAISEFYESGAAIKSELSHAAGLTWLVVGIVTALMMAALSGIVARGSSTIDEQRKRLQAQVGELRTLLAEKRELSQRVQRASSRTAIINEKLLRRVGADLHDGPAQSLSLALLRLDALAPLTVAHDTKVAAEHPADSDCPLVTAGKDLEKIRTSLSEAMRELRDISSGLALPELGRATLAEVVQMAVRAHERRTETRVDVELDFGALPAFAPVELKTCVYRLVQEALNNAFRHAQGKGQHVQAGADGSLVRVEISDSGPGFPSSVPGWSGRGLGLSGMRERIESLGGTMEIGAERDGGARIVARFDIERLIGLDDKDG